jgi:hypothetical protein
MQLGITKKLPLHMPEEVANALFNRLISKEKLVCQSLNDALISKGLRPIYDY